VILVALGSILDNKGRKIRLPGRKQAYRHLAPSYLRFRHGKGYHDQGQARIQRRYRLLLCDQEEFAHDDRKAEQEKYDPVAKKHVEFREAKIK